MLGGLIGGLITAWILAHFFGADEVIIRGIQEWTGKTITVNGYYVLFAVIGILGGIVTSSIGARK